MASRTLARRNLLHFTTYTFPTYQPERAHRLIADYLDRVLRGEIDRLMVFSPPQHGKSQLVSIQFPAYWLGHRPDDPVILTSYAGSLAHTKSSEARAIVESSAFQLLFRLSTDKESRARDFWRIDGHRGRVVAAGVGGPITGHGATLGIIDDPVENWAQAQSQTTRDAVWNWYQTTFRTRIWEKGAIVLIMTRWHADDLAGRLLSEQPERWAVLRLPALAETQDERDDAARRLHCSTGWPDPLGREPGEPLCPGRFSKDALEQIRRDVGSMAWAAEYQGVPRPAEGNRLKRAWFSIVEAAPANGSMVRYWDKAGTAGGGAYTAGVKMLAADGLFYVVDVMRGQWSAGERETIMRQVAMTDGKQVQVVVEQEPGSGGKESAEATIRNLAGFAVYADKVTGSKDTRLEPFAAQAEAGNVKILSGEWNRDYIDELCAVPNSQYRDQVDATAGAFNRLTEGATSLGYVDVTYGR